MIKLRAIARLGASLIAEGHRVLSHCGMGYNRSALVAGLIIANAFPRFAEWLKAAVRPELYIKIAIVLLGAYFAVTIAGKLNLAGSVLLRGVAAIIEAYLIYWAVVYFVARKWFGFSREWAAPLASGISICGVSAAIATGGAIRARPVVPVLVSSLVVIFAVVEVLGIDEERQPAVGDLGGERDVLRSLGGEVDRQVGPQRVRDRLEWLAESAGTRTRIRSDALHESRT
jgi:uncharacterized membrane protein YadS